MKSQYKIIQKFKPTKINGVDFYSDVQVWKMIDMAYEQIRNKEETKECTGADVSGSFEAPIFGKSAYVVDVNL